MESSILFCALSVVILIVFDMYIYYTIERLKIVPFEDVTAVQVVFWGGFGVCFFSTYIHASQNHKI